MNAARLVVIPSGSVFTVNNFCWNWYLRIEADVTSLKLPWFSFLTTSIWDGYLFVDEEAKRWLAHIKRTHISGNHSIKLIIKESGSSSCRDPEKKVKLTISRLISRLKNFRERVAESRSDLVQLLRRHLLPHHR